MTAKKPRKANFSQAEVDVLVEAVSANYNILYGKFSPSLTNSMKTSAWEDVTEKVNAVSLQCSRDVPEIKKKWQDLQSAAKKKEGERRKYMKQTGGGPVHSGLMKPWEEKIVQFLPKSAITGLEDGVDTSYAAQVQVAPQQAVPSFIVTEVPVEELEVGTATVPIESQVSNMGDTSSNFPANDAEDDSLFISSFTSSRGKRRAQPSTCDETQRLIEIEEEKLVLKKKRLEVEEEKLKVMNNCFDLLQKLFSRS